MNTAFLGLFWDLASDVQAKRVGAACSVAAHVRRAESLVAGTRGNGESDGDLAADTDYTLKRLIRGLGSSRDAARHGFATCLSEILSIESVPIKYCVTQIEELTKIKGSMKPVEQRELTFAKLFAYLALIRSGRLAAACTADSTVSSIVLQKLLQLYDMKDWLREVVTEAILSFMAALPPALVVSHVLPALRESTSLPSTPLAELSAWQLLLALGIERYADLPEHAAARSACLQLLPSSAQGEKIFSAETLPLLAHALLGSTASFPKIHRCWDYLLGEIFGMDAQRVLPNERAASLTAAQEQLLQALVSFLDTHMLPGSRERRSVAFRVSVTAVRLAPVELIPVALSKACVRHLVAARTDKKKVLYALAGGVLKDIVSTAGADDQSRVALANCLVRFGGANFDAETGVSAVGSLLQGLGEQVVVSHIRFLGGIVHLCTTSASQGGVPKAKTLSKRKRRELGGGDEDEEEKSEEQLAESSAVASVGALAALVSNPQLGEAKAKAIPVVLAMLVRLACFGPGVVKAPPAQQKANAQFSSTGGAAVLQALKLLDSPQRPYPESVSRAAGAKLLSLLANVGSLTPEQAAASGDSGAKSSSSSSSSASSSSPTLLQHAAEVAALLRSSNMPLLKQPAAADEDAEEDMDPALVMTHVLASAATLGGEGKSGGKGSSVASSLRQLLLFMLFVVLAPTASADEEQRDVLEVGILSDLADACVALSAPAPAPEPVKPSSAKKDKKSTPSTAPAPVPALSQEELQLNLLSLCIKALSLHQSSRGVRAAVKDVWAGVSKEMGVTPRVIREVVEVVMGLEEEEEDEEDEDDEEDDDDDDDDDEDDDDEDDEEGDSASDPKDRWGRELPDAGSADFSKLAADEDEDDDDDDEGEEGVALHGEEADAALAALIEQRRKGRKQHQQEARRRELAWRTRVLDILEVTLHRTESAEVLLDVSQAALSCLRSLQQPSSMAIPEGKSMETRLRLFLEQKVLRRALAYTPEAEAAALALLPTLKELLLSPQGGLHITARLALLAVTKLASASAAAAEAVSSKAKAKAKTSSGLSDAVVALVLELQAAYFGKKSRNALGTHGAFVEEVFSKLGDFSVRHLLSGLTEALGSAKSGFLKAEACKVWVGLLSRQRGLTDQSRASLNAALPQALAHVAASLAEAGDKAGALSTKLARPLLAGARDMIAAIRAGAEGGAGASLEPSTREALSSAAAALQTSPSPVVASSAAQLLALVDSLQSSSQATPGTKTKGQGQGQGTKRRERSDSNTSKASNASSTGGGGEGETEASAKKAKKKR